MEAEVEQFVLNSQAPHRLFSGEMSSYDRLLVHRTAQHWGLDTSTVNQGPDHGSILAVRTPRTGLPTTKLTDLEVTMEEPAIPTKPPVSSPTGPAPKVLVRRRGERPRGGNQSPSGVGNSHGGLPNRPPSMEDRELHYERARARIFGGEGAGGGPGSAGGYPGGPGPRQGPTNMQMMAPMIAPGYPQMAMQSHQMQQQQHHQQYHSGGAPGGQQHQQQHPGGASGNRGKAQLRNRQEDLSDPDFRRGRHGGQHAGGGPRFDPGFGEDPGAQGGMYIRPTYTSEFPELAGQGGGSYQPSPRANGAHAMYQAGPGAGGYHPGMMSPMSPHPYAYGQPMMAPSSMAGGGGGGAVSSGAQAVPGYSTMHPSAHPMYAAAAAAAAAAAQGGGHHQVHPMQYPGGYAVLGPYGYVPVRGQDGMVPQGMVPMMYTTGMYPHPGSPPMGATGMPPGAYMPRSPTASSGGGGGFTSGMQPPSPGGWQNRGSQHMQRGGGRTRGGGGGASRGSSSTNTTPRSDVLPPHATSGGSGGGYASGAPQQEQ